MRRMRNGKSSANNPTNGIDDCYHAAAEPKPCKKVRTILPAFSLASQESRNCRNRKENHDE